MRTLADALMAARGKALDKRIAGSITNLTDKLRHAQRFVFSEHVLQACGSIAKSKPTSLVEAVKFSKAPFNTVWLEWPGAWDHRPFRSPEWPENHVVYQPLRVGCLLESLDASPTRFSMTFAWEHSDDTMSKDLREGVTLRDLRRQLGAFAEVCPLEIVMDWTVVCKTTREDIHKYALIENLVAEIRAVSTASTYCATLNNADVIAASMLDAFTKINVSPYCEQWWNSLSAKEQADRHYAHRSDLEGEPRSVIALLCMLNAKNLLQKETIIVDNINRVRKLRGQIPFLDHTYVDIDISRACRGSNRDVDVNGVRQHIVRGHFKIKKGGIYWWRPFLRGDASLGTLERQGYRVNL